MPKPLEPVVHEAPQERPFDDKARAQMKEWVDNWKRVGPILEAERVAELRGLSETESARIAVELVWPMGTLGDHRGGDDAAGLMPMKDALLKLGAR